MIYYKPPYHAFSDAIRALAPNASFTLDMPNYDEPKWISGGPYPSKEQILAKAAELEAALPMKHLREIRDRLLTECDWVVVKYLELGQALPSNWAEYRQQLRNLPSNSNPYYDGEILAGVVWPTKPQ